MGGRERSDLSDHYPATQGRTHNQPLANHASVATNDTIVHAYLPPWVHTSLHGFIPQYILNTDLDWTCPAVH